jgi:hypothetical protein
MSITMTVDEGSIKLPTDLHLPDGTHVRIEGPEPIARVAEFDGWLKTAAGAVTSGLSTDESCGAPGATNEKSSRGQ